MIGIARSSAKLLGARAPTRDPFNFRKPHKDCTLRRPVRSTQEIRPRKIEKVKRKGKERSKESVEEEDGARKRTPMRVHRVCGQNNGGTELAEEMNGERGRQDERIENIAAGKKKTKRSQGRGTTPVSVSPGRVFRSYDGTCMYV